MVSYVWLCRQETGAFIFWEGGVSISPNFMAQMDFVARFKLSHHFPVKESKSSSRKRSQILDLRGKLHTHHSSAHLCHLRNGALHYHWLAYDFLLTNSSLPHHGFTPYWV